MKVENCTTSLGTAGPSSSLSILVASSGVGLNRQFGGGGVDKVCPPMTTKMARPRTFYESLYSQLPRSVRVLARSTSHRPLRNFFADSGSVPA